MKIPAPKKLTGLRPNSIKGCPFCGGAKVYMKTYWAKERLYPVWTYALHCVSCAAVGGWEKTPSGALRRWNMRDLLYTFATLTEELK